MRDWIAEMLFDLFFFGFPLAIAICMAAHGVREDEIKYWRCCFCFAAYIAFYLVGGRTVLLYLVTAMMVGGGYLSVGGPTGAV